MRYDMCLNKIRIIHLNVISPLDRPSDISSTRSFISHHLLQAPRLYFETRKIYRLQICVYMYIYVLYRYIFSDNLISFHAKHHIVIHRNISLNIHHVLFAIRIFFILSNGGRERERDESVTLGSTGGERVLAKKNPDFSVT